MELVFLAALAWGVYRGTQDMNKAVKGRYRKVVSSWQNAKPGAEPTPAPLGVKLGAVTATGLFGGYAAVKGFTAGFKRGWPEGKERGADWWERRRQPAPQVEPHPTTETDPNGVQFCKTCNGTAVKDGTPCPDCLARQAARNAEWDQQNPRPTPQTGPDRDELAARRDRRPDSPSQITITKEPTVAIDTVTGGEVYTLEEVRAEAETIKKEAAADLEDAQADSQRACEDNTRIEMFAASLRTSQYGDYAIQHVESMGESSASRKQAADQRAAAAESRLAQVEAFLGALETPEGLRA